MSTTHYAKSSVCGVPARCKMPGGPPWLFSMAFLEKGRKAMKRVVYKRGHVVAGSSIFQREMVRPLRTVRVPPQPLHGPLSLMKNGTAQITYSTHNSYKAYSCYGFTDATPPHTVSK